MGLVAGVEVVAGVGVGMVAVVVAVAAAVSVELVVATKRQFVTAAAMLLVNRDAGYVLVGRVEVDRARDLARLLVEGDQTLPDAYPPAVALGHGAPPHSPHARAHLQVPPRLGAGVVKGEAARLDTQIEGLRHVSATQCRLV
jgi:hypothetical protein